MAMRIIAIAVISVLLLACERFEKPTSAQCKPAVSNLITQSFGAEFEKETKSNKENGMEAMAGVFLKGMGQALVKEFMVNDQMIAWCEVNMSVHDTNCLRAAQSSSSARKCGYVITKQGEISRGK